MPWLIRIHTNGVPRINSFYGKCNRTIVHYLIMLMKQAFLSPWYLQKYKKNVGYVFYFDYIIVQMNLTANIELWWIYHSLLRFPIIILLNIFLQTSIWNVLKVWPWHKISFNVNFANKSMSNTVILRTTYLLNLLWHLTNFMGNCSSKLNFKSIVH